MENLSDQIAAARAMLDAAPSDPARIMQLSRLLARVGDVETALALTQRALDIEPASDIYRFRSELFEGLGKRTEAIKAAQEAVELAPSEAGFKAILASLLLKAGQLSEAKKQVEAALALNANMAWAHMLQAEILKGLGDQHAALEAARRAAVNALEDWRFKSHLSHIAFGLGDAELALSLIDDAIALNGDTAKLHQQRAQRLLKLNRYSEAALAVQKAIDLSPDDAPLRLLSCQILMLTGELEHALLDINRALDLRPDNAEFHLQQSIVLAAQGQVNAAIEAVTRAHELVPQSPQPKIHLGRLLASKGEFQEALTHVDQAIALGESNADIKKYRDFLADKIASAHAQENEQLKDDLLPEAQAIPSNSAKLLLVPERRSGPSKKKGFFSRWFSR